MTIEEAKTDFRKQIDAAQKHLRSEATRVRNNKTRAVLKCIVLVEGTAKELMTNTPLNTSVTYWHGKIAHHPSFEGNAPAVDMGTLRNSITHDIRIDGDTVRGRVGSIIQNPPYGAYLETGTSRMAARPWLLPALDINVDKIRGILNSVFSTSDTSVNIEGID